MQDLMQHSPLRLKVVNSARKPGGSRHGSGLRDLAKHTVVFSAPFCDLSVGYAMTLFPLFRFQRYYTNARCQRLATAGIGRHTLHAMAVDSNTPDLGIRVILTLQVLPYSCLGARLLRKGNLARYQVDAVIQSARDRDSTPRLKSAFLPLRSVPCSSTASHFSPI